MEAIDWKTLIGLVGFTLVISGSNVLPQFRDWCQGFQSSTQPLRWLGVALEFAGIVTDKSMATGFIVGLIWWSGPLPWRDVFVLSGQLTVAAAMADAMLALMQATLQRAMGPGMPVPPVRVQRNRIEELEDNGLSPKKKRKPGEPLSEEEAFGSLDDDEGGG